MAFEAVLIVALVAAVVAPHVLALDTVSPRTASFVWLTALVLRGLVSLGAAAFALVYLPGTEVFSAIARWCWHAVVPLLTMHLGLSGHRLAHGALVVPSLLLAGSLLWVLFGLARGALALWLRLRGATRGSGPLGATVVIAPDVLVAVTAFGKGRVLVSEGALRAMDRDELAAGLAHELGHLHRWHRPLLLLAAVLSALGRPLPGTRAAALGFEFSLERDADEYAVRHTRDPLALASAICKAARGPAEPPALAIALAGRTPATLRVAHLVGDRRRAGALREWGTRALAAGMAAVALALGAGFAANLALPRAIAATVSLRTDCPT